MAAPTFVAASTGGFDVAGAWTATCHAPGAAGRILIFQLLQDDNINAAPAITSTTNIENLAGTAGAWTTILLNGGIGSPTNTGNFALRIGRSTSTSAPVVSGTNAGGDDLFWRFYEFQNVSTGTTLGTVIENVTAGSTTTTIGTSTSVTDAAVTTLDVDRLAVNFGGSSANVTVAVFTGQTGGTWAHFQTFASASGTAATLFFEDAAMATAGTIDGGTVTITSNPWGVVGFALIGTTVATPSGDSWINDRRTPRRRSMQRW